MDSIKEKTARSKLKKLKKTNTITKEEKNIHKEFKAEDNEKILKNPEEKTKTI